MDVELGPLRARERPFILVPLNELLAWMAHLQQHLGLLAPAGVFPFEEMAEELLLQAEPVVRIEMRPVLDAMHLEPFLFGGCAHKALKISARMQPLSAPVGGGEQRRLHLCPVRHARLPVGVGVELARDTVLVKVAPVAAELLVGERLRPRHPVAVHAALETAPAATILHGIDLRLRPVLNEATVEDATVVRHIAVKIGRAFPDADGREVFGLQRRGLPLVLPVIGNAVEADLAVRPGLRAAPLDTAREVLRFAQRPDVDYAGRATRPAAVDA